MARRPELIGLVLFFVGLLAMGAGPSNGDIVVYLESAQTGGVTDRWTHALYVAWLSLHPTLAFAEVSSIVSASLAVGWMAQRAGLAVGLILAACVLPWLPYGEVDLLWLLGIVAACDRRPVVGAIGLSVAIAISPTALVILPWILYRFRDRRLFGASIVPTLSILSGGEWLSGNRGLLTSSWSLRPLHALTFSVLPVSLLKPGVVVLLCFLPVLLAPSDVPAWWALVVALGSERPSVSLEKAGVLAIVGLVLLLHGRQEVVAHNAHLARVASTLQPGDPIEGSFSDRERIRVLVKMR